jgi:hypothetical protein
MCKDAYIKKQPYFKSTSKNGPIHNNSLKKSMKSTHNLFIIEDESK